MDIFMDSDEMMEELEIDEIKINGILIMESQMSAKGKISKEGLTKTDGNSLFLRYDEKIYNRYKPHRSMEVNGVEYLITNRGVEFGMMKFKLEEIEGY